MAKKPARQSTKARKSKRDNPKTPNLNKIMERIYTNTLDGVEKQFDLGSSDSAKYRLSSGLLMGDFISGGGFSYGMTTVFGPEQSGKSTYTMTGIRSAIKQRVPLIAHFDAEGTAQADPDFAAAILRVKSLDEIYGKKIGGEWSIPPLVRYWDTTIIEKYFDSLVRLLNRIPDKLYLRERDEWFLRVALQGSEGKRQAPFLELGEADNKLSDKQFAWIPTKNPYPQALIVPDSYVTFLSENIDENEEVDGGLAEQARSFAKHLRRVVGKFRRKQVAVFGANQLRERPGVVMGPKTYEPAGNALKLYSSMRFAMTPRATPNSWRTQKLKTSQYSEEPSVEGRGTDAYAWKHIKNVKNKFGTPWMECWSRVWIRDRHSRGRGFDPVFDTAEFLRTIGLAEFGQKHAIKFNKSDLHPFSGKTLSWEEFKTLIVAEEWSDPDVVRAAGKITKGKEINLRAMCFDLVRSGKAMQIYNDNLSSASNKRKDKLVDLEAA